MVLDPEDVDDGDAALVGRTRSIPDWDCNPQSCQEDCNVHKLSCLLPWSAHLHRKLQSESIPDMIKGHLSQFTVFSLLHTELG